MCACSACVHMCVCLEVRVCAGMCVHVCIKGLITQTGSCTVVASSVCVQCKGQTGGVVEKGRSGAGWKTPSGFWGLWAQGAEASSALGGRPGGLGSPWPPSERRTGFQPLRPVQWTPCPGCPLKSTSCVLTTQLSRAVKFTEEGQFGGLREHPQKEGAPGIWTQVS